MTSRINPAVTIKLDKERHLLLDLNAMVAFQEETGKNLFDRKVIVDLSKTLEPKTLRTLIWACLLHEDEALTQKQAGKLLRLGNLVDVTRKLIEAWEAAMTSGSEEEVTEAGPLPAKPPTG